MEVVDGAVKQSAEMDDDLATLSNTTTVQTIVTGEEGEAAVPKIRVDSTLKIGRWYGVRPSHKKNHRLGRTANESGLGTKALSAWTYYGRKLSLRPEQALATRGSGPSGETPSPPLLTDSNTIYSQSSALRFRTYFI
ncbi:hypothetical protein PF005_g5958 [Phytophthora fragariae]|uniref:Uncharacterized protein n=1 Tax=Phytophthora fragariae TaxID=53985 RepID=A0A6A3YW40_9STRA|nr:hypothetical protein PF005_g5958 [Phytophthora fragariae]